MGHLTDDMARLRAEINALKSSRYAFRNDLSRSINQLKEEVASMQNDFRRSHADMAKKSRSERLAFVVSVGREVGELKRQVANHMKGVGDDIKGAHRAWWG